MAQKEGIRLKKKYGQHFLRDQRIVQSIVDAVELNKDSSVFEIGCGDGFLTRTILQTNIARLFIFEIDQDWVEYIAKNIQDERIKMHHENFLDVDIPIILNEHQPWTLLANLPYQVTFPILHKLQENRHLLKEGVVMVQEEVAQKITKTSGRGYGFISLYFQYYFDWKMLEKIPPSAFYPPPKVFSRLLYFKPKKEIKKIPNEEKFWDFIKVCFKQPRRTLLNNLRQAHYDYEKIAQETLKLRSQQLNMENFLAIWEKLQ